MVHGYGNFGYVQAPAENSHIVHVHVREGHGPVVHADVAVGAHDWNLLRQCARLGIRRVHIQRARARADLTVQMGPRADGEQSWIAHVFSLIRGHNICH